MTAPNASIIIPSAALPESVARTLDALLLNYLRQSSGNRKFHIGNKI
ncbi:MULTISPECIES: hypothetical protein [unclassified Microcoleus]|nr:MULTISPECIES: hypothetical protein [unclassified Microcoleus]